MQDQIALDDTLEQLKRVSVLERLQPNQLRKVADKVRLEAIPPNKIIIEEGDRGRQLYIIVSGHVLVTKYDGYRHRHLAKLGPGDFFGEIALLKNVPRTARIITLEPCQCLVLEGQDFLKLYQEFPSKVRDDIQIIIAKRLKYH